MSKNYEVSNHKGDSSMKTKTTKQLNKLKKRRALAKLYTGLETARAMLSPWAIHHNSKRKY